MREHSFFRYLSDKREALPGDAARASFDSQFLSRRKNPVIIYGFSYFLGWLGVDRFVLGQWGLGLGKLFTMGVLWILSDMATLSHSDDLSLANITVIWLIVDWFLIGGATRKYNAAIIDEISSGVEIGTETA